MCENIFYNVTTNIIEYSVFNPDNIFLRFCELTTYQITNPIYYKIDVSSMKNFRLIVNGFKDRKIAFSIAIREING